MLLLLVLAIDLFVKLWGDEELVLGPPLYSF